MEEEHLKKEFAKDVALLKYVGIHPVIVHGGGPMIGRLLKDLQIPTRFVDGLRVTDEKTLEVVEMVLAGLVNKEIVKNINDMGGRAIGLSGKDGRLLTAKQVENKEVGLVGDITGVNSTSLRISVNMDTYRLLPPLQTVMTGNHIISMPIRPQGASPRRSRRRNLFSSPMWKVSWMVMENLYLC